MYNLPIRKALSIIVITLIATSSFIAQNKEQSKPSIENGEFCESVKAYLDYVAVQSGKDKLIFLVARLGNGESSTFNHRRLANVYRYLNYQRGIANERIIKAEGERMHGLGQFEVYVGGKLLVIFTFKRNKDILARKACNEG